MATTDHRKAAETHVTKLIDSLKAQPPGDTRDSLISECESLVVAIRAFHMEGIRFRMFNVDRLLARSGTASDADRAAFTGARHELEAAGFHTRSHQAPG
jgi:hypothetical protein